MTYHYRRAIASEAKPLIGLYAESGCGKTYGALLIARGFVDDMSQVAMIETEAGRGEAHADDPIIGGYNVIPLREEFSPSIYGGAIALAEKENARVLIIDSASHEWEGIGGVLEMAEKLRPTLGTKGMWRQPKLDHARQFMLRMTQTQIPLVICCMRAKYPMYEVTKAHVEAWEKAGSPGGKAPKVGDWARSWKLEPKQSDDILSEMFVHGWIDSEHRFHLTKDTKREMREVFLDNEPLSIETGKRLAAWSSGRLVNTDPRAGRVTDEQVATLRAKCKAAKVDEATVCKIAEVQHLEDMPAELYAEAARWLDRKASADTGKVHATGAPEPITDEVDALRKIENSKDAGEASAILDLCSGQPFYDRAAQAVRAQFP